MNVKVKIALYVLLTLGALFTGLKLYAGYKSMGPQAELGQVEDSAALPEAAETAGSSTNEPEATADPDTNTSTAVTTTNDAPIDTAATTETNAPAGANEETLTAKSGRISKGAIGWGDLMGYLGGFLFCAIGLGILIAHDASRVVADQAVDLLYNDDNVGGFKSPEYDKAEEEWANGNFLEAIELLRAYQKRYPREVHCQVRIAEIYEKDLQNPLAAALEYEEILKYKLPPDRWGWYAIHLCNVYFRLDKQAQAVALLQRLHSQYPETNSAAKARKRLGEMGIPLATTQVAAIEEAPPQPSPDAQEDKLPPGFRKRR